ncbi:MAG: protein-L-isoaspartate(D-aspartate) O-methyltransferase [Pseudomonadota bacterium]
MSILDQLIVEIEFDARVCAAQTGRATLAPAVLSAIRRVPRGEFVPREARAHALENRPLPIGHAQTISQPFIVALMTDLLDLTPHSKVLEIGTGSGYQAAVIACLAQQVISVEVIPGLATEARQRLARLGYTNIEVHSADGRLGWPPGAPYDGIIVTAAAEEVPAALLAQLKIGGRLVIPLGAPHSAQSLYVYTKHATGIHQEKILDVLFVPLIEGFQHHELTDQ